MNKLLLKVNRKKECIKCLKKHTSKNEFIRNCPNCDLLHPYRKYIKCSYCETNEILTSDMMPLCSSCNTRCYFEYIRCFNCDSKRLWSKICFNDPNQKDDISLLNLEYNRIRREKEEMERERREKKEMERERRREKEEMERERRREIEREEIRKKEGERELLMKTERCFFKDIPISEKSIIQHFDNEEGVNLIYIEGDPVLKTSRNLNGDYLHLYHLIYKQQKAIAKLQNTLDTFIERVDLSPIDGAPEFEEAKERFIDKQNKGLI
jgi:hypothetical protein